MEHWRNYDETFRYMMLSRMQQDCEYYLDHGRRNPNVLWAGSEVKHIEHMRALWNTFSAMDKPDWLSYEDIEEYARRMGIPDGKVLEIYNGKYRGVPISEFGMENGELDYRSLAKIIEDYIPNNRIRDAVESEWDLVTGSNDDRDEIMHEYMITEYGFEFLKKYTDEMVFYNEEVDIYIWAVTHTNTSWDYVLTGTKLVER
jgi:hypothetical protein